MRQAFEQLLSERDFSKITVIDIVARADLNRSTFYAHYPDIYGIVEEIQEEIIQKHLQLFSDLQYRNILKDPMPYLNCITSTMRESVALTEKIGISGSFQQKSDRFQQLMEYDIMHNSDIPEEVRNSPQFAIRVHFFLGGILNTYQRWAEGSLNCALEQVTTQIAKMIQQTASEFLETNWTEHL